MIHERKECAERTLMLQQSGGADGTMGGGAGGVGVGGSGVMMTTMGSGMGGITGGMTGVLSMVPS